MNREQFVRDIPFLSSSAVKVLMILDNIKSIAKDSSDWIEISYNEIKRLTGLNSGNIIKKAIEEITLFGWMLDYEKGGYDNIDGKRIGRPSKYKISENKLSKDYSAKVFEKVAGKYERVSKKI